MNAFRAPWSVKEKTSLSKLIKSRLLLTKKKLTGNDWKEIAKQHNAKFRGTTLAVGEKLAASKSHTGKLGKGNQKLTESQSRPLLDRSVASISSMVKKWPDVEKMILETLQELSKPKEKDDTKVDGNRARKDEEGYEGDEEEEVKEDSSSGDESEEDFDPNLEEDSDDEMDGAAPASNQTGAILIAAA